MKNLIFCMTPFCFINNQSIFLKLKTSFETIILILNSILQLQFVQNLLSFLNIFLLYFLLNNPQDFILDSYL